MGTRSRIAMVGEDGKVRSIYCHWDGYPSGVGKTLFQFYTDPTKISALIDLGGISSLNPEIGDKHDFDRDGEMARDKGWTTAYHRDRGESLEIQTSATEKEFRATLCHGENGEQYIYLFKNGAWYFTSTSNKRCAFRKLTEGSFKNG